MATDAQLLAAAQIIHDETGIHENTAVRVGQMLIDIINSKLNLDDYEDNAGITEEEDPLSVHVTGDQAIDGNKTFNNIVGFSPDTVNNANHTATSNYINLNTALTANRVLTLPPTPTPGQFLFITNQNPPDNAFKWSFNVGVYNPDISTTTDDMENSTNYLVIWHDTGWKLITKYTNLVIPPNPTDKGYLETRGGIAQSGAGNPNFDYFYVNEVSNNGVPDDDPNFREISLQRIEEGDYQLTLKVPLSYPILLTKMEIGFNNGVVFTGPKTDDEDAEFNYYRFSFKTYSFDGFQFDGLLDNTIIYFRIYNSD